MKKRQKTILYHLIGAILQAKNFMLPQIWFDNRRYEFTKHILDGNLPMKNLTTNPNIVLSNHHKHKTMRLYQLTLILLLSLTIGQFNVLQAQNITLSTQAEVDAWDPSLTEIPVGMTVTIRGADIVNVDALSNVTLVAGTLRIWSNDALTNIDGLSGLSDVSGSLTVNYNDVLTNIDGLSGLSEISGSFNIQSNNGLMNIDGLFGLSDILGSLTIGSNSTLTNIAGLSGLSDVSGNLTIVSNNALTNIDGLSGLIDISGYLTIQVNSALTNIDGLSGLSDVSGTLYFSNNDALTNIDGLSGLSDVSGNLTIQLNSALTNIAGLSGLSDVSGSLTISNNNALTNIDGLSGLSDLTGFLEINLNEALTNISGLSGLSDVLGSLNILNSYALTNIDGLSGLSDVSGSLRISSNNALTNIAGLSGLSDVLGSLEIWSNNALTNIAGLSGLSDISGSLTISNNYALTNINGLSGLSNVTGTLIIRSNSALTNIDDLSGLNNISGSLRIGSNDALTNIDGLSGLNNISGSLEIWGNDALTNIDALSGLIDISGYLTIRSNNALTNIDGLSDLIDISGNLTIQSNSALTNIDGLSGLSDVLGSLEIWSNDALTNIDGLSGLNNISGSLKIWSNNALTNIDGLSGLSDVSGSLTIQWNSALTHIDGLSGLIDISGTLSIDYNNALTNIDGLSGLSDVSGSLYIRYNNNLSNCCGIRPLLESDQYNDVNISSNLSGCNSIQDILDSDCGLSIQYDQNPPCIGLSNGSIDVFASNYDTIPFYYTWEAESGVTGSGISYEDVFTIDGLATGTYTITVTQDNGEEVIRRNIVLDPIMNSSLDITNIDITNTFNNLSLGSIYLDFNGGVAPYEVSLTGPFSQNISNIISNNAQLDNLSAGDYSLLLRDAAGQTSNIAFTVLDEDIIEEDCVDPMDIIILNLVSFAINADEYAKSKDYFTQFCESLNLGNGANDSRVAIAEWSGRDQQDIKIPISGDLDVLSGYAEMARSFTSSTDILGALRFANDYLAANARPNAQKVIIFTYDGCPGFSAAAYAEELKDSGVIIADIGIDYVNNSSNYQSLLRQAATKESMAYFASNFDGLDPLQLYTDLVHASCSGSSFNINFDRDGSLIIDQIDLSSNCPYPEFVEVTFTVAALEQLSIPVGTPVSFYHNDPTLYGASYISTFNIPCSIPAGESETFTVTLPIATATHLYAVLNDDASTTPSFELPLTDIAEITYANNIDDVKICVGVDATIQALKSSVSLYPICENVVQYRIDVCNIGEADGFDIEIQDEVAPGFVLIETQINTNNCAEVNNNTYDLQAGCCISMTLSYDVSAASSGYYGDQDVLLSGPPSQIYLDFDGANTTAEDILLDGTEDCGDPRVTFTKSVDNATTCVDHSLTYTFTIENRSSNPLYGIQFTDILPAPLEWVYKPYQKDGLSITVNDFLEGQTASFTIDQIDAESTASFVIDVYVGYTDVEVTANNTARIEGLPDYINGGIDYLESNTTTTTILADIEIISLDTISMDSDEYEVQLLSLITPTVNIEWLSSGDGAFSDNTINNPLYVLGAEDRQDTLIELFIGVDTYCGQKGQSVFIKRNPCAIATISSDQLEISCYQESVLLDASTSSQGSEFSYAWYNSIGDLVSNEIEYETTIADTYTLEITNTTNDCETSDEVQVTDISNVPDANIVSTENVINCKNENIVLSVNQEANVIYTWTLASGEEQTAEQITIATEGNVVLQAFDPTTGCYNDAAIMITMDTISPTIQLLEPAVLNCSNTTVYIDATSSDLGAFQWYDSNDIELNNPSNILETSSAGWYYYQLENEDNACISVDSVEVKASYSEATIEMPDAINLTCTEELINLNPIVTSSNDYAITWTLDGQYLNAEDNPSISVSGIYILEVKDMISDCITRDTVQVNPPDDIESLVISYEDALCNGDNSGSILISDVIGGTSNYSYYVDDVLLDDAEVNGLAAGVHQIKVVDALGCDMDTLITILEPEQIFASTNIEEHIVKIGQDVEVNILTNIDINDISTVTWSPAIDCENCLSYVFQNVSESVSYTVSVVSDDGCEEFLAFDIIVDTNEDIYLPNVISTNSSENNVFFPQTTPNSNAIVKSMSIYDRWGNLVYFNENFLVNDRSHGWNGKFKNEYVISGVYVYLVVIQNGDEVKRMTGDLTLLR